MESCHELNIPSSSAGSSPFSPLQEKLEHVKRQIEEGRDSARGCGGRRIWIFFFSFFISREYLWFHSIDIFLCLRVYLSFSVLIQAHVNAVIIDIHSSYLARLFLFLLFKISNYFSINSKQQSSSVDPDNSNFSHSTLGSQGRQQQQQREGITWKKVEKRLKIFNFCPIKWQSTGWYKWDCLLSCSIMNWKFTWSLRSRVRGNWNCHNQLISNTKTLKWKFVHEFRSALLQHKLPEGAD